MRSLDESREILYVIRTLDVLMGSGVGLEAAIHSISQGGYGIISKDFEGLMENINKGRPLEKELRGLLKKAETDGYKRVINTMLNNVTQNTDIIETLRKQGERMEETRTESVKEYIEELGGVPETLAINRYDWSNYSVDFRYRTSTNGGCRRIVWSNGPGHDYEYCQRRFVPDFVGDGNDWSQGPH